jgi:hypothetical protein
MADIISLNRARKVKAKVEDKARAVVNRVAHGRTQAEKALERARAEREARLLDQHKRDR